MVERRKKDLSSTREVEEVEVNAEVSLQANPKGGKALNPGRPHPCFGGVGGKFFFNIRYTGSDMTSVWNIKEKIRNSYLVPEKYINLRAIISNSSVLVPRKWLLTLSSEP